MNHEFEYLYAARDVDTGKLVSNITNPGRKYWNRRGAAQSAIDAYNNSSKTNRNKGKYREVELVVFKLIEVKE
jgi:hypothetical protein